MTAPTPGPMLSFSIEGSPYSFHPVVQSPVPNGQNVKVYFDGRIISFVAHGKPFFLYVMPQLEADAVDLETTDWFSLGIFTGFAEPLTPYSHTHIVGPEHAPEGGYSYTLHAIDEETGLGLQYPLNRYKHPVSTSILFFGAEPPRILRGPLHTDVIDADRAYPGGYTHTIPYADAVKIGEYGNLHWMKLVVPSE